MSGAWLVSYVLLWAIVVALAVVTMSLIRQLGLIAVRLNPSSGLDMPEGPGPGSDIAAEEVALLNGREFVFGGERSAPLLTVFLSPDCSICNAVGRHVRSIRAAYPLDELDVLLVINATPRVAREYVTTRELSDIPTALKQNFPRRHAVESTPFALALDPDGTVVARGTPNALEHLEEMIRRAELGYQPETDGAAIPDDDRIAVITPAATDPESET